jgi:hypothetical protein
LQERKLKVKNKNEKEWSAKNKQRVKKFGSRTIYPAIWSLRKK